MKPSEDTRKMSDLCVVQLSAMFTGDKLQYHQSPIRIIEENFRSNSGGMRQSPRTVLYLSIGLPPFEPSDDIDLIFRCDPVGFVAILPRYHSSDIMYSFVGKKIEGFD